MVKEGFKMNRNHLCIHLKRGNQYKKLKSGNLALYRKVLYIRALFGLFTVT